jgi:DNA-binding NarL/FixJ family response regulator
MNGHKILVMGDGSHLFRSIRWVLEYKGFQVSLAPNADAALVLLIEQNYDLLIAKLAMEDLQSLDVLKRARKLNPATKLIVASSDCNAVFPLEAYQIEVDDYLLLPMGASELMRRIGQCLKKVLESKAAKAVVEATKIDEQLCSLIILMFHDIRGYLVSTAASLKLLKRRKYGPMDTRAAYEVKELYDQIKNSTNLIDEFTHEMLSGQGRRRAGNRSKDERREPLESAPEKFVPELWQSAETMGELS